jgi:V/A-type H+-transporting ATPase subunit F
MFKAAVIGDMQSVLGFRALGLTVVSTDRADEAAEALHRLAKEGHAVIYITEQLAALIPADIARYVEEPKVAVFPFPPRTAAWAYGDKEVHKAVERAVGADILRDRSSD